MPAVTVNVPDEAPDGTVTEAGTTSAALLLESVTAAPPGGAACVSDTVQVDEPGALNGSGVQDTVARVGTETVIVAPRPLMGKEPPLIEEPRALATTIAVPLVTIGSGFTFTKATAPS